MIQLVLLIAQLSVCCSGLASRPKNRIESAYDNATGKLQLIKYDSDGDGRIDTFAHMDGTRVTRLDVDVDNDGKIDRWQYYGPDRKIEKVGFSLQKDGIEDAWIYVGTDGATSRVESSPRRDGKVSRTEYYEENLLVRAEEDGDGDGRVDKWETYEGARLAIAAFDTTHRGAPDRRIVYGADQTVRVEVDSRGDGHFAPVDQPPSRRTSGALR